MGWRYATPKSTFSNALWSVISLVNILRHKSYYGMNTMRHKLVSTLPEPVYSLEFVTAIVSSNFGLMSYLLKPKEPLRSSSTLWDSGVPPSEVAHSLNNSSGHDLRRPWLWINGWKSNVSYSWSGCVQNAKLLLILTRNPVAGRDGTRRLIARKIRSYLAVDPNFGEFRREKKNAFHTLDLLVHLNNRLFSVYLVRIVKEITSQMSKTRYNPFK